MIGPAELLLAFVLDSTIGDPRWLPHPVRIIGKAIARVELFLRRICTPAVRERAAGIILVIIIVVPCFLATVAIEMAISLFSDSTSALLGTVFIVYLAATTIALKELTKAAGLVIDSIKGGRLTEAREKLGMIVGRDTQNLSEREILKAVAETVSENLSDGIIAPMFYLVVGGLPLSMAYKAVNTLDSMVGYKNARYLNFGWASARLDDLANYIPARISGLIIVFAFQLKGFFGTGGYGLGAARRSLRIMVRDGRNHSSPNSGVPEAAMAGGLGIRMGGPSTYGGMKVEKPYIGEENETDYLSAAEKAISIVRASAVIGLTFAVGLLYLRSSL